MSGFGFKGFRKPEAISQERLMADLEKIPSIEGRYILWTGDNYNRRPGSLRSGALAVLKVEEPVALRDWIIQAARAVSAIEGEEVGYDPRSVRAGLKLHYGSKPVAYLELRKDDQGNYVNVNEFKNGGYVRATKYAHVKKPGDIVIAAADEVEPAKVEAVGTEVVETQASKTRRVATKQRVAAKKAATKGKPATKRA